MIFLNPNDPSDRWRLTLAHELGHIVLHHHQQIPPDDHALELEAYDFAAEFLTPRQEIAGHLRNLTVHRLASLKAHWRVSMAALLKRAEDHGCISHWGARRLWMYLRQHGTSEPVRLAEEHPEFLRAIVSYHMDQLGHSVAELSTALHQWPDEFRADFGIGTRLRAI